MKRFYPALLAYAVIALLAWFTLGDDKLKLGGLFEASPRQFVLGLMAIFALLTLFQDWKHRAQAKLDEREEGDR